MSKKARVMSDEGWIPTKKERKKERTTTSSSSSEEGKKKEGEIYTCHHIQTRGVSFPFDVYFPLITFCCFFFLRMNDDNSNFLFLF